jgi:hypothetical protein
MLNVNLEAKTKEGSGKYVLLFIIIIIIKRQQHAKAVFDVSTTTMFEKKKKYVICIIWVSLTDFPEHPSVLASMFYHVEPDNDFAIRCIQKYEKKSVLEHSYSWLGIAFLTLPRVVTNTKEHNIRAIEATLSKTLPSYFRGQNGVMSATRIRTRIGKTRASPLPSPP